MKTGKIWLASAAIGTAMLAATQPAMADATPECNNGPGLFSSECGAGSAATADLSTATGQSAQATGVASTATGSAAFATAEDSTATGAAASATAQGSTATGASAVASGEDSTSTGQRAEASGNFSTAAGQGSRASDFGSTAIGTRSQSHSGGTAVGIGSGSNDAAVFGIVAVGANSFVGGAAGVAIGNSANAIGAASIAIGGGWTSGGPVGVAGTEVGPTFPTNPFARSEGDASIALGSGSHAIARESVAIGAGSISDEENTVSFGNGGLNRSPGGRPIGPATRRLVNVTAGINDTDAVNVAQMNAANALQDTRLSTIEALNATQNSRLTALESGASGLGGRVGALELGVAALNEDLALYNKQAIGGIAAAMAMGGAVIVPDSNVSMSFNLATYRGEQGFSGSIIGRVAPKMYIDRWHRRFYRQEKHRWPHRHHLWDVMTRGTARRISSDP